MNLICALLLVCVLSGCAADKNLHFALSIPLGAVGYKSCGDRILCGAALGLLPGLAKEVADSQERGNRFDAQDLAADAAGALLGAWLMSRIDPPKRSR